MRGIVAILVILLLLLACQPAKSMCNAPYFEWQSGKCCLDQNGNNVCDTDEEQTPQVQPQPPVAQEQIQIKPEVQKQEVKTVEAPKVSQDRIIYDSLDKVVKIYVETDGTVLGSGFFVSEDGFIITNFHVVEALYDLESWWNRGEDYGPEPIKIETREGKEYLGNVVRLIGGNDIYDMAVLKVTSNEKFPFFEIGGSYTVSIGDTVYALGSPQGLDFSASKGVISAKNRVHTEGGEPKYLQTDAAINSGNSGGPLMDEQGRVIGVNTYKLVGAGVEGLGFALEPDIAKQYYEVLKQIQSRVPRLVCKEMENGAVECEREVVKPKKIVSHDQKVQVNKFDVDYYQINLEIKNTYPDPIDICFRVKGILNGAVSREEVLLDKLTAKSNAVILQSVRISPVLSANKDTWDEYFQVDAFDCNDKKRIFASSYRRTLYD